MRGIVCCILFFYFFGTSYASNFKGDMDDDGKITIGDALKILRTAVGLETAISNTCASDTPAQAIVTTVTGSFTPVSGSNNKNFPGGVTWIGDITYDSTSKTFWALVGNTSYLDNFVHFDASGNILKIIPNATSWINHGSELSNDGSNLWATSYGWSNGSPKSFIYKVDTQTGNIISSFPCPASSTGGFCEGIAWDGSGFWSASSDNKNLVNYSPQGTVIKTFTNIFTVVGEKHLIFNPALNKIVVNNGYIYVIDLASGTISTLTTNGFDYSQSSAWDGQYVWRANNSTLELEVKKAPW